MSIRKSLRRALLPLLQQLGLADQTEHKVIEAIRGSVNTNRTALYNLLHCMPILEFLADSVGQDFEDKVVLEIGTTDPPGLPLLMLLSGCTKFYGNNILDLGNRLPMEYAEVLQVMKSRLGGVDPQRLRQLVDTEYDGGRRMAALRKEFFEPIPGCPAEHLGLADSSIDMTFSLSVLEHLENTREVLSNVHRMLRPGGWGFHIVDLRDHSDFNKPLEFLKHDPIEHQRTGGSLQNRLRAGEYLALFEESGYRIEWTGYMAQPPGVLDADTTDIYSMASKPIAEMYPHRSIEAIEPSIDDALFASLHPDFQRKSRQELSVMGMCIVCQKPN